ncbi:transposase [Actinoallomurus soli]|uniref:transposase n=1 Tax=Actinoallomurus soli TaxID=2952535 RepID=UPI002092DE13|nr:transposase [Actinoallomurus soli]MCO5969332.1 transposase [Actinoallomurus soli]
MAVSRQEVNDEVIYLRSAGVDLGKRFLLACVRTPSTKRAGSWSLETERFGTTRTEVGRLLAWLMARQVEVVVMEATSDYWRGVYYVLQPHLNLMLVNPAHLRGIRSRKSDPSDAAFLARAGAAGMVKGSFKLDHLDTILGVGRLAAEVIIAETGADMRRFASAQHLASWIGVCPGQNESAGVNKSGRSRPGNSNLKRLLGTPAMAAIRDKRSYLSAFHRRIAARRGGKRALVAVMHKHAIAIWHVLHDQQPYRDLGADYFTRRNPDRALRRMTKEANSLGFTIRFDPVAATRPA